MRMCLVARELRLRLRSTKSSMIDIAFDATWRGKIFVCDLLFVSGVQNGFEYGVERSSRFAFPEPSSTPGAVFEVQ